MMMIIYSCVPVKTINLACPKHKSLKHFWSLDDFEYQIKQLCVHFAGIFTLVVVNESLSGGYWMLLLSFCGWGANFHQTQQQLRLSLHWGWIVNDSMKGTIKKFTVDWHESNLHKSLFIFRWAPPLIWGFVCLFVCLFVLENFRRRLAMSHVVVWCS